MIVYGLVVAIWYSGVTLLVIDLVYLIFVFLNLGEDLFVFLLFYINLIS
jgi:hypothetical protein